MSSQIKLISAAKRWTLSVALISFVSSPIQVFSANPAQNGGSTITHVAKKASPAVVSISTKTVVPSASDVIYDGRDYQFEDPFEFFFRDRFEGFFSPPPKPQKPTEKQQTGLASGFIVSKNGYILTNSHVVSQADEVMVTLNDGREFEGEIIGLDPNTDVAVVKILAKNLPYLALGNSDILDVGQTVVAIGNPLGLQTSVTSGIVSAKGRNNLSLARIEDFIQTDAAINRGNSGGPLLNLNSEVVGMNTAIAANFGSGGYMGIGFAIPSNMIQNIMKELIETGKVVRGYIGVGLQQIDQGLAQAFGMDKLEGALVAQVAEASPAETSGMRPGDVILKYNGKLVDNIGMLRNAVALMKPGSEVKLTILRDGSIIELPLTIGRFPGEKKVLAAPRENTLGIDVETLTPQHAKHLGYRGMRGAIITSMKPGSPAAWAGLRKGTLIVAVNHHEIESADEFYHELAKTSKDRPILLLVKQGEAMHFVSIKVH